MAPARFTADLFGFLAELKRHNDRAWFAAHKARYQHDVRDPMLRFIEAAVGPLERISRAVVADPRPVGGSLFRIYRDTRFAKDKSPYKTHAAAHFRHSAGRDVHAPGYYLHLEPGRVLMGAGIWHPAPEPLQAVRTAVAENAALWRRITTARRFTAACHFEGEAAKRPPRGFPPDHPLIEDIKRRDFTVLAGCSDANALAPDFLQRFVRFCKITAPLNEFLARALGLEW
jgi:uncharacterized protein (TIGR02453 family)